MKGAPAGPIDGQPWPTAVWSRRHSWRTPIRQISGRRQAVDSGRDHPWVQHGIHRRLGGECRACRDILILIHGADASFAFPSRDRCAMARLLPGHGSLGFCHTPAFRAGGLARDDLGRGYCTANVGTGNDMQSQAAPAHAAPAPLLRTMGHGELLVRRIGPPAVMVCAFIILTAWILLLGYGFVALVALAL